MTLPETNKTFEQLLQEQYQQDAIERKDIWEDDYLELDPDNVKSIKKALIKFLTQKHQEHKKLEFMTRSPEISKMHWCKADGIEDLLAELKP